MHAGSAPQPSCPDPCCPIAPQVKILTNHLPCGQEVTIDLEPSATKDEIRAKLEAATGVPRQEQKLLLSGINQIVMGDKRCGGGGGCGAVCGRAWVVAEGEGVRWVRGRPAGLLPHHAALPASRRVLGQGGHSGWCLLRRTNIRFSACGSTNGVQMAVNSK